MRMQEKDMTDSTYDKLLKAKGIDINPLNRYNYVMPYKNKEDRDKYYRKWYATNGRNRHIDYVEAATEWQNNHPDAMYARRKVAYAVKSGKMIKPIKCSECDRETRLSAHHKDYSKPLEVLWLCGSCHKLKHPIKKPFDYKRDVILPDKYKTKKWGYEVRSTD